MFLYFQSKLIIKNGILKGYDTVEYRTLKYLEIILLVQQQTSLSALVLRTKVFSRTVGEGIRSPTASNFFFRILGSTFSKYLEVQNIDFGLVSLYRIFIA